AEDGIRDRNVTGVQTCALPIFLSDQRVGLSGRYLPDMQVLVTDRLHEGESGFWVVTMFEVDGAEVGEEAQLAGADTAGAEPIAKIGRASGRERSERPARAERLK